MYSRHCIPTQHRSYRSPFHQSSCSRKPFVPKLHCQQKNQTHLNKTCAADLMPATSAVSCPPSPAAIPAPGALPRHLWGVLALKMRSHGLDRERWWETALEASPSQASPKPCMPADQRCCPQPAHHHTPDPKGAAICCAFLQPQLSEVSRCSPTHAHRARAASQEHLCSFCNPLMGCKVPCPSSEGLRYQKTLILA